MHSGSDNDTICFTGLGDLLDYIQPNDDKEISSKNLHPSAIVMFVIGSISILANVCSLLAIAQVRRKLNTYLRLIISLSISDILVGVCVLIRTVDMDPFGSSFEVCVFINWRGLKLTSHLISLLNLLGLGMDHYYAIIKPLQYRCKMSSFRANLMIICFWIISIICGFSDLFVPSSQYSYCAHDYEANMSSQECITKSELLDIYSFLNLSQTMEVQYKSPNLTTDIVSYTGLQSDYVYISDNGSDIVSTLDRDFFPTDDNTADMSVKTFSEMPYENIEDSRTADDEYLSPSDTSTFQGFCQSVMCSKYDGEYSVFLLAGIILLSMLYLYTRVCITIYSMSTLCGRNKRTLRRNKKGLVTTLCILGTFMGCWLPYCIFTVVSLLRIMITDVSTALDQFSMVALLDMYLYDLLLLNCLCDPLIYAFRMREVRIGYIRLARVCCRKHQEIGLRSQLSMSHFSSTYGLTTSIIRKTGSSDKFHSLNGTHKMSCDHRKLEHKLGPKVVSKRKSIYCNSEIDKRMAALICKTGPKNNIDLNECLRESLEQERDDKYNESNAVFMNTGKEDISEGTPS